MTTSTEFSLGGVLLDDVIIRLQESWKESSKTVLLSCLFGVKGKSFRGVEINRGFGDICLPVPSDVDVEELLKEKKKKWNEGEMGLNVLNGKNGMEFQFWIFVKGSNHEFELIPTGQVEKGIKVIKDAFIRMGRGEKVKVFNCGWVLN